MSGSSVGSSMITSSQPSRRSSLLLNANKAEPVDEGPKRTCDICYEDYPESRFFGLKCNHESCKACLEDHLMVNINDGNVQQISLELFVAACLL